MWTSGYEQQIEENHNWRIFYTQIIDLDQWNRTLNVDSTLNILGTGHTSAHYIAKVYSGKGHRLPTLQECWSPCLANKQTKLWVNIVTHSAEWILYKTIHLGLYTYRSLCFQLQDINIKLTFYLNFGTRWCLITSHSRFLVLENTTSLDLEEEGWEFISQKIYKWPTMWLQGRCNRLYFSPASHTMDIFLQG
jgi:hypothetical protein